MKRAFICFAIFATGMFLGAWLDDWLDMDTCLDRGGAWDYARSGCRHE